MVPAPPRVLPRFLAPSDVLGGGRSGPVSPLPGLGLCAPRRAGPWRSCAGGRFRGGGGPCAVPPVCAAGGGRRAWVRSASFRPSAFPGQATKRVSLASFWSWGAWSPYHSGSCSPAFSGRDLCGVLARWRGLACSRRFLWEPAAGVGGPAVLQLLSLAGGGGTIPPAWGARRPAPPRLAGRWGGWGGGGSRRGLAASPLGGGPRFPTLAPLLSSAHSPPACAFGRGRGAAPGGGGDEGRPVDRSPRGSFRPEHPLCPLGWAMVTGGVMGGAAPILFWCAAVRRPQAWSARCSGALVWARPLAATPAGAGGWGRWGARCAGSVAPPPPPRRGPFWGRGGVPSAPGGRRVAPVALKLGGGAGGGGVRGPLRRPPPPLPHLVSACHPLSLARPPGVYSCPGGCQAAVGVGRGPVGCKWVSAAGREGRGGNPPALVSAPAFLRPASEGAAPFAPSWAPPVRRRLAAGKVGACGRFTGGACRGRGATSPRVQRPLRGGCGAAVSSICLRPLLDLGGRGGGVRGGPLVPWGCPLTAEGGRPGGPGPGGQPSAEGSHSSPAPLYLEPDPRAGTRLGPLSPPPSPRGAGRPGAAVRVSGQRLAGCRAVGSPPHSFSLPSLPREVARAPLSRRIVGGAWVGGPPSPPHSLASAVWAVTCAAACVGAGAAAVAVCAGGSASGRGRCARPRGASCWRPRP